MSNWGNGYREGYKDAARKLLAVQEIDAFMEEIHREEDGSPSKYAVANKCCGGVDAHSVGCRS